MNIPKDPFILFSFINTKLRDFYPDLDELCKSLGLDHDELTETLEKVGFKYDKESNHIFMTGPATEVFQGEIAL